MQLSLIVAYRNRETHLKVLLNWWKKYILDKLEKDFELIIIESSQSSSLWIQEMIKQTNIKYLYLENSGVFHKTKALNLGLKIASGSFVVPYDVDLIPIKDTLEKHLKMAQLTSKILITGYRIMYPQETIIDNNISLAINNSAIAPEDSPEGIWCYLTTEEKFGVLPFFCRDRLISIDGWDEYFIGWGAEDQDIIERYLQDGRYLCRCPELVYLHLNHESSENWNETSLVDTNRKYYYEKLKLRQKN